MSDVPSTARETERHRTPLCTDGGEEPADRENTDDVESADSEHTDDDEPAILEYGDPAKALGEPDMVFGRHGDELVLIPEIVLGWTAVEENTVEPGKIRLDGMSRSVKAVVFDKIEAVELDRLAAALAEISQLDSQQARVLLLFEGFQYTESAVAERLDIPVERVEESLDEIYGRYDIDAFVEDVCEHSTLNEQEAAVLVLAEGYELSADEIAAELDIAEEDVHTIRRTVREEHDVDFELPDPEHL